VSARYTLVRDVRTGEGLMDSPGIFLHMRDVEHPPRRLQDPVVLGGEMMDGHWELVLWDAHVRIGVFYPSDV
jgi:hypothetical protein